MTEFSGNGPVGIPFELRTAFIAKCSPHKEQGGRAVSRSAVSGSFSSVETELVVSISSSSTVSWGVCVSAFLSWF